MFGRLALLLCWGALGCAAPAQPASHSEPPRAAASARPEPKPAPPALKVLPEAHSEFPLTVQADDDTSLERVFSKPMRALAIDRAPHVSALSDGAVYVHDAKGWREETLPKGVQPDAALALFYGRDYRLRLVGTQQRADELETLYYRWLPGGFRAAPDEIGRLGSTRKGGFVALLGTADPEVVCRPRDVCLIKRVSGWATIVAPEELELVAIRGGRAWAVSGHTLLTVDDDKRWKPLYEECPWKHPDALWVDASGVWVVESERGVLHHFEDESWSTTEVPSCRPRVLWSSESGKLWLGCDEGLFRQRGSEWRKVSQPVGAVSAIVGRSDDDVWIAARAGLFHTSATK